MLGRETYLSLGASSLRDGGLSDEFLDRVLYSNASRLLHLAERPLDAAKQI
jgi:hypothetical protein